jgi:hypothetical protein
MAGKVIGLIPKNFIIVLIEQHAWYEHGQNNFAGPVKTAATPIKSLYRSATIRDLAKNAPSPTNRNKIDDESFQESDYES